jgi:virginiamycin B lyase
VATAGVAAALAPAALAAPALDPVAYSPSATPRFIVPGPDGNVWFTLPGGAQKEFGKIAPDGTITEYDIPGDPIPGGIASAPSAVGQAHDRIWIAYINGVYIFDPATSTGTAHTILTLDTVAGGLTADADGNVWAKEANGGDLVKVAPDGTKIADVPTTGMNGRGAALGSDGRIWWSDTNGRAIHATSTAAPYTTTPYPVGGGVGPQGIVAGPAGQLGFGNPGNELGTITTAGAANQVTDTGSDVFGISYAADGAYWVTLFAANKIGRLTPDGQYTKPIDLPAASGPRYIAAGPGNTVWVTAETDGKIYRITGVEPPPPPAPPAGGGGDNAAVPPPPDTTAPGVAGAKVNARTRKLSLQLSEAATLRGVVQHKRARRNGKRYWKSVRNLESAQHDAGRTSVSLGKRRLARGSYRIKLTATDAAGNVARKTVSFRVR